MIELDRDRILNVAEFGAPVSRVWNALTDHKEFGRWFCVDLDEKFEPKKKRQVD